MEKKPNPDRPVTVKIRASTRRALRLLAALTGRQLQDAADVAVREALKKEQEKGGHDDGL